MIKREDYTCGEKSLREYYGQFVNNYIINAVINCIGADKIMESKDKSFNDISLRLWDNLKIMHYVDKELFMKANNQKNKMSYSLSDSVCIAKEAARIFKENN